MLKGIINIYLDKAAPLMADLRRAAHEGTTDWYPMPPTGSRPPPDWSERGASPLCWKPSNR
jgi:hypothetical protein